MNYSITPGLYHGGNGPGLGGISTGGRFGDPTVETPTAPRYPSYNPHGLTTGGYGGPSPTSYFGWTAGPNGTPLAYPTTSTFVQGLGYVPHAQYAGGSGPAQGWGGAMLGGNMLGGMGDFFGEGGQGAIGGIGPGGGPGYDQFMGYRVQ